MSVFFARIKIFKSLTLLGKLFVFQQKPKQKNKFQLLLFFIKQKIVIHRLLPDYSQSIEQIFHLGSPMCESFLQQECFPA